VAFTCENQHCTTGTCTEAVAGPVCNCPSGFGGPECDDENECAEPGVCAGAECVNGFGYHYCDCSDSEVLAGEVCEDLDECESSPCSAEADCEDIANGYTCTCKAGFFGNGFDCVSTDPCAANPCGDGGTCIATSAGAVCQCPAGKAGQGNCDTVCDSLTIPDRALAVAIQGALGMYLEDIVPAVHLASETSLDLSGTSVTSLDGLECWPTLQDLNLSNSTVGTGTDDTPLAALRQLNRLVRLDLGCVDAPDLNQLSAHPTLSSLYVGVGETCLREDVGPAPNLDALSSIKQLRDLDISGQPVTNTSLAGLRALTQLTANDAGLSSLDVLSDATLLRSVFVASNEIEDASVLANFPLLTRVVLDQNPLEDADFLLDLPRLESLDVANTGLETLPSLADHEALRSLNAIGNQLSSLTNIAASPTLFEVLLVSNNIKSLAPLAERRHVGSYLVNDNPLDCEAEAEQIQTFRQEGLNITTDCAE